MGAIMSFRRADIESIYGSPFIAGNRVEILTKGGEAFRKMLDAVRGARHFVLVQFYIYRNDETGSGLGELLKERAARGVRVYLLHDHLGSRGTPKRFWRELMDAGIRVRASHPFRWRFPTAYLRRDHRKVLIVDGMVAFTGGLNIANEYAGFPIGKKEPWRDTAIIIQGPAAHALTREFIRAWKTWDGGEIPWTPPALLEPAEKIPGGTLPVMPIFSHSGKGRRRMRRLLYYSINHAKLEICITTAYFSPSRMMLHALEGAARRGVRVRLLVPGKSDVAAAHYAGRALFSRLLKAGVEIWSYGGDMLHAKTFVFDGIWSVAGSANLDFRSMRWNDEGSVGILDEGFSSQMLRTFEDDLSHSTRITPEEWARRPFCDKLKERFFSILRRRL